MTKLIVDDNGFTKIVDLPALTGSPKQIDWATEIRAGKAHKATNDFDNQLIRANNEGKLTYEQHAAARDFWWNLHASEFEETKASNWISGR